VAGLTLLAGWRLRAAWNTVLGGEYRIHARARGGAGVAAGRPRSRRPGVEAAVFRLTRKMIFRDSLLAARSWPAFGLAAAALLLGALTDQLADPFRGRDARSALTLAYPVLVAAAVPLLYQYLVFSKDHEASWVLRGVPARALARGVRRAVLLSYVLPMAVIGAAVMGWQWRSPLHAALEAAVLWLLAEGAARLSEVYVLVVPPFSRSPERGGSTGRASLGAALVTAAGGGVVALQYAGAGQPLLAGPLLGGMVAAVWLLDRWANGHG
jgi:hypothetical protein